MGVAVFTFGSGHAAPAVAAPALVPASVAAPALVAASAPAQVLVPRCAGRAEIEALRARVVALEMRARAWACLSAVEVWDLGECSEPSEIAVRLRPRLDALGPVDAVIYEFQMVQNDKSRAVSNMIAYHYAGLPTVRVQPAVKNTVHCAPPLTRTEFERLCPRAAAARATAAVGAARRVAAAFGTAAVALTHSTFLAQCTTTYRANKLHTAANFEWYTRTMRTDLGRVPAACMDDAGDAFMQALAVFRGS